MRYDSKAMLAMATEFLFSKKYGIWVRKVTTKDSRCFSVFNERDEILYSDLEFGYLPHALERTDHFKRSTRMTLEQAFQLAGAYVDLLNSGKKIGE
jgi:hypothetical protein